MTLKRPVDDEDRYRWEGADPIRAVPQPASSALLTEMYGERAQRMLLMLYDGPFALEERMGVCVYVPAEASCDYRIVSAERWNGHQRVVLESIPEAMRG